MTSRFIELGKYVEKLDCLNFILRLTNSKFKVTDIGFAHINYNR